MNRPDREHAKRLAAPNRHPNLKPRVAASAWTVADGNGYCARASESERPVIEEVRRPCAS